MRTREGGLPLLGDYPRLKRLLQHESLPAMVVDLDAVETNLQRISDSLRGTSTQVRIATKSLRVPRLLQIAREQLGSRCSGFMAYSVREALGLAEQFGDTEIVLGYPSVDSEGLRAIMGSRRIEQIVLMVDCPEHITLLEDLWRTANPRERLPWRVALDVDVGWRPLEWIHLGVRRSPLRSGSEAFRLLARKVAQCPAITFVGLMGYEAHIAGVPDRSRADPFWKQQVLRIMKWCALPQVRRERMRAVEVLRDLGLVPRWVNGGGTGSLALARNDRSMTEVTVGSGILQSHLFDDYRANFLEPAIAFALPITRRPSPCIVTCHSGGFIASGVAGAAKVPRPILPLGMQLLRDEGCGEVQTPLWVGAALSEGPPLALGDPVFFRPAKAGEIAENFEEYLLVRAGILVERARTYRGLGQRFF